MLNRSQAFGYYRACNLSYTDIDPLAIQYLICVLDEKFALAKKEYYAAANTAGTAPPMWAYTLPVRSIRVMYDSAGGIRHCHINAKRSDGSICEAISFFENNGISFAKGFIDEDIQPVLLAFIEWCEWLNNRIFAKASLPCSDDEDEEALYEQPVYGGHIAAFDVLHSDGDHLENDFLRAG